MPQCSHKNANEHRCSNRAIPGSDFCDEHRQRVLFVRKLTTPTPQPEVASSTVSAPAEGARRIRKSNRHQVKVSARSDAPRLAGLRRDARGILVGPQAIVRVAQADRLKELLAGLSGAMELSRAEIRRHPNHGHMALIEPPDPHADDLSLYYDRIAAAARLSEAEFWIGADEVFVSYRDPEAPFGYDLTSNPARKGKGLRLFGFGEPISIAWQKLDVIPIRDIVLDAAPSVSRRPTDAASRIYVLAAAELQTTFCRYFRSHGLAYRLVRFPLRERQTCILFEAQDIATPAAVPAFVIAYLRSFPRTVVLMEVFHADRRQILLELGCTAPWTWPNTVGVFPQDCLLALGHHQDFPNLCLEPAPSLIDGDTLVSLESKELPPIQAAPLQKAELGSCRFEIRFQRDNGPAAAPVALLLSDRELAWLRRLLYKLPASEFSRYHVLRGSPHSVLLADQAAIRDLPFGEPMKRILDSGLFIPCRLKLVPDLPLHLLAGALRVDLNKITLLTKDVRLEAERTAFVPLSDLLYSDLYREPVELELQPPQEMPSLQWSMPKGLDELEPAYGEAARALPASIPPKLVEALQARGGQMDEAQAALAMKSKAGELRAMQDFLGAALYYALAGDLATSAELFRQQAEGVRLGIASSIEGDPR